MNLVSEYQKMNSGFLPNMLKDVRWKELKDKEKREVARAFVDKSLEEFHLSEVSEVLTSISNDRDSIYFK